MGKNLHSRQNYYPINHLSVIKLGLKWLLSNENGTMEFMKEVI